jgi:hypothetical protein
MRYGSSLIVTLLVGVVCAGGVAAPARAADKARITGLSDVSFGLITSLADHSIGQSVCAYSSSNTNGYSVTATGSGSGESFALLSGADQLAYDVLWADDANQSGGIALVAGTTTGGFTSVAKQQFCNSGPSTSATLTVVIRSTELSAAMAGSYSGTLQITIAPE